MDPWFRSLGQWNGGEERINNSMFTRTLEFKRLLLLLDRVGQLGRISCVIEDKDELRFWGTLRFPLKNKYSAFNLFIVGVLCLMKHNKVYNLAGCRV